MSKKGSIKTTFKGVPTFAGALFGQGQCRGGGYEFARHTRSLFDGEGEDSEQLLDELSKAARDGDRAGVLRWYKTRFPGVMALVPSGAERRWFVAGVFDAVEAGITDL